MTILMLIRKLGYSGAFKMFIWLAESLEKKGHSVTVCTWGKNDDIQLSPNIKWIKLNKSNCHFFSVLNSIKNVIRGQNSDICISFLLDANVYNTIGCIGQKTKSIICERNDPYKPRYYKLKFWKPLFRFSDGAVFQLPLVAQYYSNIKKNVAIIPNPVFSRQNIHVESTPNPLNVIVTVARLDCFQKRQDILLMAFAKFLESCPNFILRIYGDGPDEPILKDIVNEYQLEKSVQFMGVTNNVTDVLLQSKIFVLTSDFEGIPNALIEAMSLGLPCISTDCRPGGARLLINNKKNGLLVPCGDIDAISEAMVKLATDAEYALSLGSEAKKIKETFNEDIIIDKWTSHLQSLISD